METRYYVEIAHVIGGRCHENPKNAALYVS